MENVQMTEERVQEIVGLPHEKLLRDVLAEATNKRQVLVEENEETWIRKTSAVLKNIHSEEYERLRAAGESAERANLLADEIVSKIAQEGFEFDEDKVLTAEEKESHRTQQALYDYLWEGENEKEV